MGVTQDMWLVDFVEDEPFGRGGFCEGIRVTEKTHIYMSIYKFTGWLRRVAGICGAGILTEDIFGILGSC